MNDLINTEKLTELIQKQAQIDAIYLYGSRAKGMARKNSNWDIAVLFTKY